MNKHIQSLKDLCDTVKLANVYIMGVSRGEREGRKKKIPEVQKNKTFSQEFYIQQNDSPRMKEKLRLLGKQNLREVVTKKSA